MANPAGEVRGRQFVRRDADRSGTYPGPSGSLEAERHISDGTLFDSTGRVLHDALLYGDGSSPASSDLTTVFEPGTRIDGGSMARAWTVDASVDEGGRPVTIFQARVGDAGCRRDRSAVRPEH